MAKSVHTSKCPPAPLEFLNCAHAIADLAAAAIKPHFRKPIFVTNKGGARGFDPVTKADQAAERAMVRHLERVFPTHGILGEEYGTQRPDARFCWVLDPIDGTRAFIMGLPTWGTLIGLRDGDTAIMGVMNQPFTGERYWAMSNAAYLRSPDGKTKRLKTRACTKLTDAIFSCTTPELFAPGRQQKILASLRGQVRLTRYGADCYGYCQLAAGHIDVIVEPGLQPYDIVALIPIIEAAGGRITTFDGGSPINGGDIVATGDPKLHTQVLDLINEA